MKPESFALRLPLFYFGLLLVLAGLALYIAGVIASVVWLLTRSPAVHQWAAKLLFDSEIPGVLGAILIAADLFLMLPSKRRVERRIEAPAVTDYTATVALTAYNDEESIAQAVEDFLAHPRVRRVLVVDNNSRDQTAVLAERAGAIVVHEAQAGDGRCVYRCLSEALHYTDTPLVVLCEGDRTFRASDLEKLFAYAPHADIVNGTRIVEQLRASRTQLSTFMYYGNFFAGTSRSETSGPRDLHRRRHYV